MKCGADQMLQSLLWMEPDHPVIILRLAFVFLCALPAVRELFQYINDPRLALPSFGICLRRW